MIQNKSKLHVLQTVHVHVIQNKYKLTCTVHINHVVLIPLKRYRYYYDLVITQHTIPTYTHRISQFLNSGRLCHRSFGGTPLKIAQRVCSGSPCDTRIIVLLVNSLSKSLINFDNLNTISVTLSHPESLWVGSM